MAARNIPERRKKELLETAEKMFYSKGFENTSVKEITDAMGVAKGTFYYYFSSKDELLTALAEYRLNEMNNTIIAEVMETNQHATAKMRTLFTRIGIWKMDNIELVKSLIFVLYSDKNLRLRYTMNQTGADIITPNLIKIIKQGISEGEFDLEYPEKVAEIIMRLFFSIAEPSADLVKDFFLTGNIPYQLYTLYDAIEFSIGRILGVKEKSLELFPRELLDKFFKIGGEE